METPMMAQPAMTPPMVQPVAQPMQPVIQQAAPVTQVDVMQEREISTLDKSLKYLQYAFYVVVIGLSTLSIMNIIANKRKDKKMEDRIAALEGSAYGYPDKREA